MLAAFTACQPDLKTIEDITRVEEGPAESTFNLQITYTERAQLKMTMTAPRMDRYTGQRVYMEMPEGLEVLFYDSLGNVSSSISARYAISHGDNELIEARNDVVVINEMGERLNTEELIWDQKREIIYSEKFVKITRSDEVWFGDGLEADERFTQWVIKQPRGNFTVELEDGEE